MARRPWLLEKLTGPRPTPSIKMNPPRPPAAIPQPVPKSRSTHPPVVSEGWTRRGSVAEAEEPDLHSSQEASPPTPGNRLRGEPPQAASAGDGETGAAETDGEEVVLEVRVPALEEEAEAEELDSDVPSYGVPQELDVSLDQLEEVIVRDLSSDLLPEEQAEQVEESEEVNDPHEESDETTPTAEAESVQGQSDEGVSQYIEAFEDEPEVQLDYTGLPLQEIRLTNSVYRIRNTMRQCLRYYYGQTEKANERSNWGMLHAIMVYGADTQIQVGNQTHSAIAWIAGNNACRGQRLMTIENDRIAARSGVGLQGHQAQMLAIFALCGVPADYPMYVGEEQFTLRDVIETEMLACRSGQELTFTLIALSHYLDTDATWVSSDGQTWDFERLIREELTQPIVGAACGGTHRLMGFGHALRKRRAEGRPITGQWKRAEIYTQDFVNYAYRLQNRDGSMTTDWFEGREDNGNLDRKIQTTGHIVEWLLTVTPDSQLQNGRLVNAIRFLLASMYQERQHDWRIGPKGHALRSLAMFYERVYQSGPAWRYRSMAKTENQPRR